MEYAVEMVDFSILSREIIKGDVGNRMAHAIYATTV